MRFGIIGAGPIALSISKKLVNNNHDVKIADARDIERLKGKPINAKPVTVVDVISNIDVLIISIPLHALPTIRSVVEKAADEVIVVDTSNYYPQMGVKIDEIENGMVESVWVTKQLGRSIIKAFNNLLAYTLEHEGTPEGSSHRIAVAIAGDDIQQKQTMMSIVSELGFDTVDSGNLNNSWRQQPGTPAYCTELTKEELNEALQKANKEQAPFLRDKAMEKLITASVGYSHKEIITLNREMYNS
ncbi:NADPH-dependent F420 reductase [Paenibacillus sp. FSL K6-2862]|uniref:NADPH-dependent F420 reductase n=1 Tax=Paenibacillus sp. FSL K6-2862 TaxID=2921484 RepID=UPI0030FA02C8